LILALAPSKVKRLLPGSNRNDTAAFDRSRSKHLDKMLSYIYCKYGKGDSMQFDWDKNKAAANEKKHGVSFEEAQTAFDDHNALLIPDPDHAGEEDRFVLLGLSAALRMLVVCHCYREHDELIRIISARKATKTESATYAKRK
jgi:uncharacterized DUF497 family protein